MKSPLPPAPLFSCSPCVVAARHYHHHHHHHHHESCLISNLRARGVEAFFIGWVGGGGGQGQTGIWGLGGGGQREGEGTLGAVQTLEPLAL
jgi:hypothetical protein